MTPPLVDASKLAAAAGVSERKARLALEKCAKGYRWRSHKLLVVDEGGRRKVAVRSLPPDVRAKVEALSTSDEGPVEGPHQTTFQEWQFEELEDRLRIIEPILAAAKGSVERTVTLRETAETIQVLRGEPVRIAERTLRNWTRQFEERCTPGLLPKARADRGKPRVLITRAWDAGIDLSPEAKSKVAAALDERAASMIANDGTSCREVIRLSEIDLQKLSAEAGSQLPKAKLRQLCKLNAKWVARFKPYRLVHMRDKDHKAWQDKAVARIRRGLLPTPMELIMGDVHHVDILVEEQSEPVRVRLIAWMEMSSLFIWVTPVFLPRGKGIRQEDVAESLAQVTMCHHGGIPRSYTLDNGSEYAELDRAATRLGPLADQPGGFTVHKARAYSPQSKGDVEGLFHILQGLYAALPGYIAGDRTNKKTECKGKVAEPYRKGLAQLEADIHSITDIYNNRPQSGRLGEHSPVQMLEKKIAESGFVARVPNEDAFDIIYSKSATATLQQGCIKRGGKQYHAPFLDTLPVGAKIELLVPLRNRRDRLYVRRANKDLGWAEAVPTFEHGDPEGARTQARLERGRDEVVRQLRAQTDPTVSTLEAQKAAVTQANPNAPAPEIWTPGIDKTRPAQRDHAGDEQESEEVRQFWAERTSMTDERKASGGTR